MKFRIKALILLFPLSGLLAQEMPQLNSYMFNQFLYNPASGGMYETDFNANVVTRIQWAGVNGAPISTFAWADHRFRKNSMSAGLVATYDRLGPRQTTDLAANYTYIVRLTNKLKLSFGLRAGLTNSQITPEATDAGDTYAAPISYTYPKFGAGTQLYNRKFYLGFSVPDLVSLNNNYVDPEYGKPFFKKSRSFILMGGYRFKLSDAFALYPNAKIYYYPGNQNNAQVNASLLFEITDYFWAGGSAASDGSAALMAGTYVSSRIRFMYAYGFYVKSRPVSSSQFAFNTHEVSLMLQLDDLFARKNKVDATE